MNLINLPLFSRLAVRLPVALLILGPAVPALCQSPGDAHEGSVGLPTASTVIDSVVRSPDGSITVGQPSRASSSSVPANTLDVGPDQTYKSPSEAAAVAKDGDHVEIRPGKYFDCAVWRADDLVIEGTAPGVVIATKTCMGKGLFVVEGNDTTVRNLTLMGARVPDGNGSGIRLDQGNLVVDGVQFIDNQDGILGGTPGTKVEIRDSDFEGNGFCGNACAHGVYVGAIDLLRIKRSRFYDTQQGHSIKSRALRTEVIDCDIADGPDGTSSYLIDAPNGGTLIVRNNSLEKGPKSENDITAIAIGEEGVTHPTPEISIINNSYRNDLNHQTALIWNMTATTAVLSGNKLSGPVIPLKAAGGGDRPAAKQVQGLGDTPRP